MRLQALLREAYLGVMSGTVRVTTLTLILSTVICLTVWADATTIGQQIAAGRAFRDSGGATLILEAEDSVDGVACDRLREVAGVTEAGALRLSTRTLPLTLLPQAPIPVFDVSAGFPQTVDASSAVSAGLTLSREAADGVGVSAGDSIATPGGDVLVASTFDYPRDGRRAGLGYAALSIVPSGGAGEPSSADNAFDECWVSFWPQIDDFRSVLLTTLIPGTDVVDAETNSGPRISQLNSSLGGDFGGFHQYSGRVTRAAPVVVFVVAGLMGFVSVSSRRLQLASALHAGVGRSDMVLLHLLESLSWTLPAVVLAGGASAVMTSAIDASDRAAILHVVSAAPLAALAGVFGGVAGGVVVVRRRRLFAYFANR